MVGFHGGFFMWDKLEKVCGSRRDENAKIQHFLGKIAYWYWYQKVVPVHMMQWESGTGATQTGTGTHWQ